jgi:methanogenic corrinoid protein MtbC1
VLAFSAGGNLHDLGIRVVGQRLQLSGFAVTNLGGNMPTSDLPYVFADRRFDLIAVSATMLSHLGEAVHLVEDVRKLCRHPVKILLGGRPFSLVQDLHARLGADAGAGDAVHAVQAAIQLTARSA